MHKENIGFFLKTFILYIIGTAKDHVMKDYGKMMLDALKSCRFVIQQAAYRYLTSSNVCKRIFLFSYIL